MKQQRTRIADSAMRTMAVAGVLVIAPFAYAQEGKPTPGTPTQESPGKSTQEKQEDPKKGDETDLRDLNPLPKPGSSTTELEDLFRLVEKRMKRVTTLLYEASSGDASAADGIGGAGIDELIRGAESEAAGASSGIARMLQATRGQGEATLQDIERILEIAEKQRQSGAPSPPSPSQGMPQQGQTPSGSRKEDKGEAPPEGGEPEGEKPPAGDVPKGGQETEGGPDGPAKAPPEDPTGDASGARGAEDWGDLPVHLRQVFQNGVSEDVPPRYRDWIDAYYKRLNRRSGR